MESILLAAVLVVGAAAKQLTINTPVRGGAECQPLLITWSGGTPPYFVTVQTNPPGVVAIAKFRPTTSTALIWPAVNATVRTSLLLEIKDSAGQIRSSAPFPVISGSGDSCIRAGGGNTGGSTRSSSPTSNSGKASTATSPWKFSVSQTSSAPQTSASPSSSMSPTSSASSSNTGSSSVAARLRNLAGPIAAGVVRGLIVVLGAFGFFLYWTRRGRGQSGAGSGGLDDKEKEPSAHLLPTTSAPQDKWTPAQLSSIFPSGETQCSALPHQVVPRGILAEEEKARRGPAQQMGSIQQDIPELTELAEAQRLAEATLGSSTSQPDSSTAQLLDEIRMLKHQVHAIE